MWGGLPHNDYNLGMLRKAALFALFAALAMGAVTKVDVASRVDLPVANYERITGKVYFAVDPKLAANKIITDIGLAPRNDKGLVEFSADLEILRSSFPPMPCASCPMRST